MDRFDVWHQHIDKIPSCRPSIVSDKQLLLLCKWCKTKEKSIPWTISSKNLLFRIILLLFLKEIPIQHFGMLLETLWFPYLQSRRANSDWSTIMSLSQQPISCGISIQSASKTACNDIISIWYFVNAVKMKTIRYQNFILTAESSDYTRSELLF